MRPENGKAKAEARECDGENEAEAKEFFWGRGQKPWDWDRGQKLRYEIKICSEDRINFYCKSLKRKFSNKWRDKIARSKRQGCRKRIYFFGVLDQSNLAEFRNNTTLNFEAEAQTYQARDQGGDQKPWGRDQNLTS